MPEGHTTHRYARLHAERFAGRRLHVTSPQGRFEAGAAKLDGRTLEAVEAYGKHLFYRWDGGLSLHVHLGLVGTFHTFTGPLPAPTPETRLVLQATNPDLAVHLRGPMACELLDSADQAALLAGLGPDPLGSEASTESFGVRLAGRRAPIGTVLLDQATVAGIGNVFRAEALFLCGLDPARPAGDLGGAEAARLWATLGRLLAEGERTGRIHTVPEHLAGGEHPARYVYRRAGLPCRRCGASIRRWHLGGRRMYACPSCQNVAGAASHPPAT